MKIRSQVFAAIWAFAAAVAQNPQSGSRPAPPAAPQNVIRITVNLVQVDAVAVDSHDRPVTDLKAADFEILQDGKLQTISNCSYIATATPRAAQVARAALPKGGVAPPPPPSRSSIEPAKVHRTIALVVDDLGLSFESIVQVRSALKKWVDQEMQPGDLVAVVRTGAGMGALQQFTTDKRMLYAAIERVKYNLLTSRVGIFSIAPRSPDTGNGAAIDQLRETMFSVGTLGALRWVVDGLRDLPGRKSAILFSENLRLFNADGRNEQVMDSVLHLTDAAGRASVVIYTIDPRGLQYYGLTAADNTSGMSSRAVSQIPARRSAQAFASQEGLVMIAEDTGGLFLHDNNDLSGQLRQAVDDGDGYYLIGYHPDANTFDAKTGQRKFHRLRIKVKRPGVHVRYRNGFFGEQGGGFRPVAHTREAEITHALFSPFASGSLHLRLTALFSNAPPAGSFINSMLSFDARELQWTAEPDGWHKTVFDVVAMTSDERGQTADSNGRTYTVRLNSRDYENVLARGLVYSVHLPVKKPGAYQMRVVLRDNATEAIGSASQYIEVPDVAKGRLALSGVVVKREMPETAAAGAPSALADAEGQIPDEDPKGTVAVRIFKPGTTIVYGYQIINAETDTAGHVQLETQTRLFHDGAQVFAGQTTPLDGAGQPDPKHLVAAGRMALSSTITPGDYVLQVIVTDKLANNKYAIATQSMDFEIEP